MSSIDDIAAWNRTNQTGTGLEGGGSPFPRRRVAIITCMDTRLRPFDMLGVGAGDIHVIRNAGAIVTQDVVRSLMLSQVVLGTEEIMVIGHTRCGLEGLDDIELRDQVERERGHRPDFAIGGFRKLEAEVIESVITLRRSLYLVGEMRGFVYDVETGSLTEVSAPEVPVDD